MILLQICQCTPKGKWTRLLLIHSSINMVMVPILLWMFLVQHNQAKWLLTSRVFSKGEVNQSQNVYTY